MYNQAVLLAETDTEESDTKAIALCEEILRERKTHMEAYALLHYLCHT